MKTQIDTYTFDIDNPNPITILSKLLGCLTQEIKEHIFLTHNAEIFMSKELYITYRIYLGSENIHSNDINFLGIPVFCDQTLETNRIKFK